MRYAFGEYGSMRNSTSYATPGHCSRSRPQVFNVLAYLIQHRDRTVPRQELLEQLWPAQYISDAVLSYCIMAARKAIGDSGRAQPRHQNRARPSLSFCRLAPGAWP